MGISGGLTSTGFFSSYLGLLDIWPKITSSGHFASGHFDAKIKLDLFSNTMVVSLLSFHRCSVVLANERIRSRAELPLYLKEGELWTDLYCKPTDKHFYLHHPSATKKAIPYGLGIRLKRICSKEDDYEKNRKRWYSGRFIEEQLKRVYSKKREDLHTYRQKSTEKKERAPLVLTFSNLLPNVTSTVHKHLKLLHQSNRMQGAFKEPPMDAFRSGGQT